MTTNENGGLFANANGNGNGMAAAKTYAPTYSLYHPTAKNTGSALSLERKAATPDREGCIFATVAPQKTVAGTESKNATFSWEEKITVKLGISDLCAMLLVLTGKKPDLGPKGLYHDSGTASTGIQLRKVDTPVAGYAFEVAKKGKGEDGTVKRAHILLNEGEALALTLMFQQSVPVLAFGI